MSKTEEDIRAFIVENFLFGDKDRNLSSEDSLLDQGIIDSTGVLEMVTFLEGKYSIEVDETELVPANLDSVNKLVHFIQRKTATSS